MAQQFRVIDPDDDVGVSELVSVFDAGENGSRLDELIQLRRILARRLDDPQTPAKELSPLVNRHMEVSREVHAIQGQQAKEAVDSAVTDDEKWTEEAI